MDELTWKPAWQLRDLMASGELSPVEVTNHFLARIKKLDPVSRAFTRVDATGARAQAARAEQAVADREPLGPLHGIPVSVKEHVAVAGLFRQHIWGCLIDDFHGVAARHEIGLGQILIEVDYPHSDSNWPNSRTHVAENLAGVPDDEAHQVVELNARKLLRFHG